MSYTIIAICPKCGKKAYGLQNIHKLFGYRVPRDKIIPQSYCKKCRSNYKNH